MTLRGLRAALIRGKFCLKNENNFQFFSTWRNRK